MPRYLFAGILLSLWVGCHQQPREVDGYLEALFDQGLLNGNVLIARGDSILYQRSFGFADPTEERPLTIFHHFAIGSIQKEFPAAAIMLLVEEGLVELEAPIAEYLPELPAWSRQVTIRHLLQYSSGLPEVDWEKWFGRSVPPDQETILDRLVHGPALLFPPGTDYSYTHYSPFLLQRIVERITALPFPVFLEEEFFYPHGMEGISVMEHYPYRDTARMALPSTSRGR
ncbi:serine hydrolase domain-containing protein [Lewinella sp. IMCC34191]|uniref:serine hydrolase domain-containing protein n=1 Tax=Lewinella sp. IMCC34191 TaxID=2259172 RepID=UPI000E275903|nr:serine hydrolase domain-containing protein [Lewinella sp. IMCC34191]